MPIDFRCSRCQNPMQRPDHMAGKKATCPKCSNINDVPAASAAASAAPPAGSVAAPPLKPAAPAAPPAPVFKPVAPPPMPSSPAPAKPAPPFAKPAAPPAPAAPKPALAEKPVVAEKPMVAEKPVVAEKPAIAEKPIVVEKPAPRPAERVASEPAIEAPKVAAAVTTEAPSVPPLAKPMPPKPAPVEKPSPPLVEKSVPVPPVAAPKPIVPPAAAAASEPTGAETKLESVGQAAEAPATEVKPAAPPAKKAPPKMAAVEVIETGGPDENRELAGPRWENYGMGLGSYFATIFQVLLLPGRTFRNLGGDVGPMPATWFMLVGLLLAGFLHGLGLYFLPNEALDGVGLKELSVYFKVGAHDAIGAFLLTGLASLIGALGIMGLYFLLATMINSILRTFGAEADSIEHTYRVLSLVLGATCWLALVPIIGPLLTLCVQPVFQALSVGPANGVSRARSLMAVSIAWGTLLLAASVFWVSVLVMNSAPDTQ